jgi:hypothetical protein
VRALLVQRAGAEEGQVVQHAVHLGQQRAQPDGAVRRRHAEHPLDRQADAQLVAEGGQPVVTVGQHHQLAVVADLEQLLRPAVQEADDRLGRGDSAVLHGECHLQHPVRGRVVRPERQQRRPGRCGGCADGDQVLGQPPAHGSSGSAVPTAFTTQPYDPRLRRSSSSAAEEDSASRAR